jgi:serine/threonine-protein kinase
MSFEVRLHGVIDGEQSDDGSQGGTEADLERTVGLERPNDGGAPLPVKVGRYAVLGELGRGAMGRVLRAYDPKLEREVALKEVRAASFSRRAVDRMIAEARSMAKLTHPNVVGIYDVLALDNQPVVLAMELVRGRDLRSWLAQESRPWPEILSVFRQAGRGLAAAHGAGVLHRDFKPANVLVRDDGVAKVTDFGIAKRLGANSEGASSGEGIDDALDGASMTEDGIVLGTPKYMSPEQTTGEELGPTTDQYAFCVSLWEALCGVPPFVPGSSRRALLRDKMRGGPEFPSVGVPRSIATAVRRGLSPYPEDRWPTMGGLLEAIEWDPERRRRRRVSVVMIGALPVLGAAAWGVVSADDPPCSDGPSRIGSIWGPSQRAAVEKSFSAMDASFVQFTLERSVGQLDDYAEDWSRAYADACGATLVRRVQSEAAMNLRISCLDRRRRELSAVVEQLSVADLDTVRNAHGLVERLIDVERCADSQRLSTSIAPPPPEMADAVEFAMVRLEEVRAQLRGGHVAQAERSMDALVVDSEAIGYGPLTNRIDLVRAILARDAGDYREAEQRLRLVLGAAARWEQADVLVEGLSELSWVLGVELHATELALGYRELMLGLAESDPVVRARLLQTVGAVHLVAGMAVDAEEEQRQALALLEGQGEQLSPMRARIRNSLGNALDSQGRYAEARDEYEAALELLRANLGPDHPELAVVLNNLGLQSKLEGKLAEAEHTLEEAIALLEGSVGPDHPDTARSLSALGDVYADQGRLTEALTVHERVLAMREAVYGPNNPRLTPTLTSMGTVLALQGKPSDALAYLLRSLDLQERAYGPGHEDVAAARVNVGIMLMYAERLEDAEPMLRRGIEELEQVLGLTHPRVIKAKGNLGALLMMKKDLDSAEFVMRAVVRAFGASEVGGGADEAHARLTLGMVLQDQERFEAAEIEHRKALTVFEATFGQQHANTAAAHQNLGVCLLGQGREDDALAEAELAWDFRNQPTVAHEFRGETAFLLARVQHAVHGRTSRSVVREYATLAVEEFEAAGPIFEDEATAAREWLAELP